MEDKNRITDEDNRYEITIMQKRQKVLSILLLLFFAGIIGRLFWVQIVQHEINLKKAASQKLKTIQVSINRGQIYDRNLIPFTNRDLVKVICVTDANGIDKDMTSQIISKATGISVSEVRKKLDSKTDLDEFEAKDFENEYIAMIEKGWVKGVRIIEKKNRYTNESLARHAIGYINKSDNKGEMGIEKSMNNLLNRGGSESIVALVDSTQTIIPSLGFRKIETNESKEKFAIKLTLDYHIQKIAEDVMKKNNITGSAVVMDVKNGDILAMVSTPDFDQNNVNSLINKGGDELINKAITAYDFGSIFKTVVAAAALENNLVDDAETFLCEGEIEVNKAKMKCSTYKSHEGKPLTFKEAFALSCNTTFIKVGMRVGPEKILDMAKRLGFGEKLCSELLEERPGIIPTPKQEGIGNISIGQGKIQVSPLQVTNMMATIANNGVMNQPNIIDDLINNDTGKSIDKMPRSEPVAVLTPEVAAKLREMLREVTLSGTGKLADLEEFGGSSGKTSSAETGMKNGAVVHGWFSGFVPSDNPQYAITVFVYNGQSGGKSAAPIFREIAYRIFAEYKPLK